MQRLPYKKNALLILTVSLVTLLFGVSVFAADFSHRIDSEKRSEKEGLGKKEIALLQRLPGPGKEVISQKLTRQFGNSKTAITMKGIERKKTRKNRLSIIGPGWYLDVNEDGSNVRYRNYGYLERKKEFSRPVSGRLTNEKLETLGRKFINETLSEYIKTGKDEVISPFFTEHAIGFAGEAKEGISQYKETVHASTIVFTRTVNEINVIGSGSKIAVMFDNEGTPIGFDYDWPQYRTTEKSQKVLPVEEIKSRAKKLAAVQLDAPDVTIKRFDCGLYDAGARHHNPKSVIQSACAVASIQKKIVDKEVNKQDQKSGHTLSAHMDFIPAGEVVEQDAKWPQAMKMLNQKEKPELRPPTDGPKLR